MSHYRYKKPDETVTLTGWPAVGVVLMFLAFVIVVVALVGSIMALAWNWVVPYFGYDRVDIFFGIGLFILFAIPTVLVRWALRR